MDLSFSGARYTWSVGLIVGLIGICTLRRGWGNASWRILFLNC